MISATKRNYFVILKQTTSYILGGFLFSSK